ncbi:MAG: hypothetical protein JWQ53_2531 [Klenkia sp.]|nr:hypothetical protein [Klenkia sp.]
MTGLSGLGADALRVGHLTLGGSRPRAESVGWLADRLDQHERPVAVRALDVVPASCGLPHRVRAAR